MNKGTILLLNGVSSSGKTTLARELVERLPGFFPLGIDDFDCLIERLEDRPNNRLIPVETEVFFHHTITMFSDHGVNLVVDHILHDPYTHDHWHQVLAAYPVLSVGVHCPVEELERRERARTDRRIGQGRQQLAYVHRHEIYDIEVDTFIENVESCAGKIVRFLQSNRNPDFWSHTRDQPGSGV